MPKRFKLYYPRVLIWIWFLEVCPYAHVIEMNKYANNYDYNKAVYLMSEFEFVENGFMLREDQAISSPIATGHYEFYEALSPLKNHLLEQQENIQCVVSKADIEGAIPLGKLKTTALGLCRWSDTV